MKDVAPCKTLPRYRKGQYTHNFSGVSDRRVRCSKMGAGKKSSACLADAQVQPCDAGLLIEGVAPLIMDDRWQLLLDLSNSRYESADDAARSAEVDT